MRSWIVWLLLAFFCAACTRAAPAPSGAPTGTEISAQAGGSVSLEGEATLLVPAGSLEHDTLIDITRLENIPAGPADGFLPFGQGYEFSPQGTVFSLAQPALLTGSLFSIYVKALE